MYAFNQTFDPVRWCRRLWTLVALVSALAGAAHAQTWTTMLEYDFSQPGYPWLRDVSGNGNDARFVPARFGPRWVAGPTQGTHALDFDGVDDLVIAEDRDTLDLTRTLRIELLLKATVPETADQRILCKWNASGQRAYTIWLSNSRIKFVLSPDGNDQSCTLTSNTALSPGQWTRVVAQSDGTTMSLSFNGQADANTLAAPARIFDSTCSLVLGTRDEFYDQRYFAGQLAYVKISTADLSADYQFEEETGTTVTDRSAYQRSGTLTGATRVTGRNGRGLSFDGVDDRVDIPHAAQQNAVNGQLTISCWVYPRRVDRADQHLVSKWTDIASTDRAYTLSLQNNQVRFLVSPDGVSNEYALLSTTTLSPDQWVLVGAVTNGATMALYLNGQLNAERDAPASVNTSWANLTFGYHGNGVNDRYFDGLLDDVRIWSTARTAFPRRMGFQVQAPGTVTAGAPFSVTVTAVRVSGVPKNDFQGVVWLTPGPRHGHTPWAQRFSLDVPAYTFEELVFTTPGTYTVSVSTGDLNMQSATITCLPAAR